MSLKNGLSVLRNLFGKSKSKKTSDLPQIDSNIISIKRDDFEYLMQIFDAVIELNKHLIAISVTSGENNDTIAGQITSVSSNVNSESINLEESYTNLMSIVANIQQVAQSSGEVTSATDQATNLVSSGDKVIKSLVNQMVIVNNMVSELTNIINNLKKRSEQIQVITDTIQSISGQTNLLALNAAIESARAGEHGRGFAVVADEVRKLSEQSKSASGEIYQLIKNIKSETEYAFEKMKTGTMEVSKGSEIANSASDIFNSLFELVSGVNIRMQEISAATEENSASSQAIGSSLNIITEKSKSNALGSKNVSKLSEQQTGNIIEIITLSQQMSELIGEFKVKLETVK